MSEPEFTEHYMRYLQAKRDFPWLNHDGHFDHVVIGQMAHIKNVLWLGECNSCPSFALDAMAALCVMTKRESIERDFYRTA